MTEEEQIDIIIDILTGFDEMGFAPTTTVPDPEAYAIKWRKKLTDALIDYRNRQKAEIERLERIRTDLSKENDELKNGFFQEHYKEAECQELLSVKEAWRKESLHNIDLEAEIERLENSLAISKKETKRYVESYNRQKAEIEELREIVFMDRSEAIKQLKAEAVKEFAERLKSKHRRILGYGEAGFLTPTDIVYVETIDNLVKEFTEEET